MLTKIDLIEMAEDMHSIEKGSWVLKMTLLEML